MAERRVARRPLVGQLAWDVSCGRARGHVALQAGTYRFPPPARRAAGDGPFTLHIQPHASLLADAQAQGLKFHVLDHRVVVHPPPQLTARVVPRPSSQVMRLVTGPSRFVLRRLSLWLAHFVPTQVSLGHVLTCAGQGHFGPLPLGEMQGGEVDLAPFLAGVDAGLHALCGNIYHAPLVRLLRNVNAKRSHLDVRCTGGAVCAWRSAGEDYALEAVHTGIHVGQSHRREQGLFVQHRMNLQHRGVSRRVLFKSALVAGAGDVLVRPGERATPAADASISDAQGGYLSALLLRLMRDGWARGHVQLHTRGWLALGDTLPGFHGPGHVADARLHVAGQCLHFDANARGLACVVRPAMPVRLGRVTGLQWLDAWITRLLGAQVASLACCGTQLHIRGYLRLGPFRLPWQWHVRRALPAPANLAVVQQLEKVASKVRDDCLAHPAWALCAMADLRQTDARIDVPRRGGVRINATQCFRPRLTRVRVRGKGLNVALDFSHTAQIQEGGRSLPLRMAFCATLGAPRPQACATLDSDAS